MCCCVPFCAVTFFKYETSMDHTENGDTSDIEEFIEATVKGQCEGLMVKSLDDNTSYQPNHRSLNWLKLKKDTLMVLLILSTCFPWEFVSSFD